MHHDLSHQMRQTMIHRFSSMFVIAVVVAGTMLLFAEPAMATAGTNSPMGFVICSIVNMVYGNLGRGLAVLAVAIVGVGATLGKVSWGMALTVATGVATVFGAVPLVNHLISSTSAGGAGYICGISTG